MGQLFANPILENTESHSRANYEVLKRTVPRPLLSVFGHEPFLKLINSFVKPTRIYIVSSIITHYYFAFIITIIIVIIVIVIGLEKKNCDILVITFIRRIII